MDEAVAALERYGDGAALLAGGTSLMLLRRQGLIDPAAFVDLGSVSGLDRIERHLDGTIEIGAMCTLAAVEADPVIREAFPALASAVHRVATVRIRNQATIGGNLAHADPAQDPPPILIALDAEVEVAGPRGRRWVAMDTFFVDVFETILAPDEVLVGVRIPSPAPVSRSAYVKFLPRTVDDYATVSVAARLDRRRDGGLDARIALGSVGPIPIRAREAEAALRAGDPKAPDVEAAAAALRDSVRPVDDARGSVDYKREMAVVWTRRVLRELLESLGGGPP